MSVPTPEQIQSYANVHERIASAIAGLTAAQLQASPAPGEWSIHQVLIHLADSEAVCYERFRRIIAEERPPIQPYNEEAWERNLFYHQQDPQLALNLFKLLRQASAALLNQLPAESWERTGLHTQKGEMSLYATFLSFLDHGTAHLRQIENTRRQLSF